MRKAIRSYLLLPLVAVLMVAIPALLFSVTGQTPIARAQTVPTSTPTSTVPATPLPTATPTRPATVPATPVPPPARVGSTDGRVRVAGYVLKEVIGNRLSPVIYGFTFNDRLYRTPNNGRSWELITTAPEVFEFLMSPDDPWVLYSSYPIDCDSSVADPLWRSDDGGDSWVDLAPAFSLLPLLADPADADTVYAAGCDGLYITYDGGQSWDALSTTADDPIWADYVGQEMELTADGGLYLRADAADESSLILYSEDSGLTWTIISPDTGSDLLYITSITTDPEGYGRLWAAEAQGVWSTEDLGQFWGLSSAGLAQALDVGLNDVLFHPRERLFLATGEGFYGKAVGAVRWTKLGRETVQLEIFNFLFTDSLPSRLWLNTENGVYRFVVR